MASTMSLGIHSRTSGNNEANSRATRSENHYSRSGLPHDLENRRRVSQRGKALLPAAQEALVLRHA